LETPPARIATIVLAARNGRILGSLPPFEAETPWWQDIGPVVRAVRDRFGLDVTVLRLLETERPSAHGGAVSYLAEVALDAAVPGLEPWHGTLTDDPMRRTYARPGGPEADLAWARAIMASTGLLPDGRPEQIRTWNLSSLWRLPTTVGAVWLKVVPPFFDHEGTIIERLVADDAEAPVPRLIGHDGPRLLLAEIPGDDRYDARLPERLAMIDDLIGLQHRWLDRADELLALGLPDWRGPALTNAIARLVERTRDDVPASDRAILRSFVEGLPSRFGKLAALGLPDGLVHGDFHPGNVRGDGMTLTILDWGDAGVGHPLLDQPAFLAQTPDAERETTRAHWSAAWRRAWPGADPDRAATLLRPVAAARQAALYRMFLDGIERAEHPYHAADVPDWLARTVALLRSEAG
jgi:Ser/Thr protein kinase RdoA (MazF antagonist)